MSLYSCGAEHLGVGFVSLTEALDLTTPAGRAMAGLLAVCAEFEREILRERVRASLDHARHQGKRLGRPPSVAHKTRQNPKGDGGRLSNFDFLPHDRDKTYDVVDRMRTVAAAHGATPAQVALAWILTKPFVSSILLGANKMAQLEDNLAVADPHLSPEEIAELDSLTAPASTYPNWFTDRVDDPAVKEALAGNWRAATA